MEKTFEHIRDTDRIWIYQSNRILTEDEVNVIKESGTLFVANWSAHGKKLRSDVMLLKNLFVIVMVDEEQAKATGCSIDKSVNWIASLGRDLHIDFLDRMQVAFMDEADHLQLVTMDEFESLAKSGQIDADTLVFNNLAFSGKELKNSWITPARESWHNRFFK
ncbi:MAG: hypothetical protein RLZZ543_936 [Bacteroidota bacterium]|jgi:hypothetical protein